MVLLKQFAHQHCVCSNCGQAGYPIEIVTEMGPKNSKGLRLAS